MSSVYMINEETLINNAINESLLYIYNGLTSESDKIRFKSLFKQCVESDIDTHYRLMASDTEYQERINIYDEKWEEIKNIFKSTGRYSVMLCLDVIDTRIEELENGEPERHPQELYELKRFSKYIEL